MFTGHKEISNIRNETALYLINKLNSSVAAKNLWTEVQIHSLLRNDIVNHILINESKNSADIKSHSPKECVESDSSNSVNSNYNQPEEHVSIEHTIVTLHQLLAVSCKEILVGKPGIEKLNTDSTGLGSHIFFDSGYDTENIESVPDLVESLYRYLINSSATYYTVNYALFKKSLDLVSKTISQNGVPEKLIDLIGSTIRSLSKIEDERESSSCECSLKVIQKICKENQIITLKTVTILVHEIVVCNQELFNDRSYVKLTSVFYMLDALKLILNNYKTSLIESDHSRRDLQNYVNNEAIQKKMLIMSFKKLEKICTESVKLLEKQWYFSPVVLSFQRSLLRISDIIKTLRTGKKLSSSITVKKLHPTLY